MQSFGKCNAYASFYLVNLVEQNLIINHNLYFGKIGNMWFNVLHSRGKRNHLLWHAVAHRQPLQLEKLLCKLLVLLLIGYFSFLLYGSLLLALKTLEGNAQSRQLDSLRFRLVVGLCRRKRSGRRNGIGSRSHSLAKSLGIIRHDRQGCGTSLISAVAKILARGSHLLSCRIPGCSKMYEQGFQTFRAAPRTIGCIFWLSNLCYLNKSKLYQQTLIAALSVIEVALVHNL